MTPLYFEVDDTALYRRLCGYRDHNLQIIEEKMAIELIPRGNRVLIQGGEEETREQALALLHLLSDILVSRESSYELSDFDVTYMARTYRSGETLTVGDIENLSIRFPMTGKKITPRTVNQAKYLEAIHRSPVTLAIGPAGTGKTYLAVVSALNYLMKGQVERIVLTRPAVEAGENLGFLPGDLIQKINPYLRPLYDALFEMMGTERVGRMIEEGTIEIAPLAYMRGRTLNNAIIILDEAQNTTRAQMKMFLTRLGSNSRFIISGDTTQIDLDRPGKSGLLHAMKILKNIEGISTVRFEKKDISRHPVVERIVAAYESSGDGAK